MRSEGRTIKAGEQPLKMVKIRASTVNKSRELEVLREAGTSGEGGSSAEVMQGLYARTQTEPYVPDPIVNVGTTPVLKLLAWLKFYFQGIVPKNTFGNIDLYVPSMLPQGATHIPCKSNSSLHNEKTFTLPLCPRVCSFYSYH